MQNIQEFYPRYSEPITSKLTELQQLIWQVAKEQKHTISESAKWGSCPSLQKKVLRFESTTFQITKSPCWFTAKLP